MWDIDDDSMGENLKWKMSSDPVSENNLYSVKVSTAITTEGLK